MTLGNPQIAGRFFVAIGHPDSLQEEFILYVGMDFPERKDIYWTNFATSAFLAHPSLSEELRAISFLDSEIFDAEKKLIAFLSVL